MARIRTIKPEFFRHYELYQAEKETGLSLRIAFVGLWTVCDREGRFKWRPEMLKVECLPYDDCDFSRVLDALWTREFIDKYQVNGALYGLVPSFSTHQVINNRETESLLPTPTESNTLTRASRVVDACLTGSHSCKEERKGKEWKGKGMEEEGNTENKFSSPPDLKKLVIEYDLLNNKEEKKEKEKSSAKKEKEELVFPFTSEAFMQKWNVFIELGKQKKKPFASKQQMLIDLSQFDEEFAINQLGLAIGNNWQGLTFSDTKLKYQEYLNKKQNGSFKTSTTNERQRRIDSVNHATGLADQVLDALGIKI